MWDSMMSKSERDRFNNRKGGPTKNYIMGTEVGGENSRPKFDRTAIALSMAVSKSLRRLWFWGSLFVMLGVPVLLFSSVRVMISVRPESAKDWGIWVLILSGLSFVWGVWGFGLWIKSLFVRWMGRKVQQDYRDGELFNR
jgi:hypothetical protein